MVCMSGHFKMASVLKLVMMGNHATPDEVMNEKGAQQVLHKQLFDAHEPNLLDEDDMHIFGSKPMADPLDLVCCSTCKKPVKASQYAAHAERCSSQKVNSNDSTGADDDSGSKKPPKKGRKIKLTSNGNQKLHIKVKAKSQLDSNNTVNGSKLNNGDVNRLQYLDSAADQRLKTSVSSAVFASAPESRFRDVPVPLATKMYHSHGNNRLRLELGQLYRQTCAEHSGSYTSNTNINSSLENESIVPQFLPCDNSAVQLVPQSKHLDQLLPSTPAECSGIPPLSASGPNPLQRADTPVSVVRNELAGSKCNKVAALSSKRTGNKKKQQQSNMLHVIKSSVE